MDRRFFVILLFLVLSSSQTHAFQNPTNDANRAEARRLWEMALTAKGGRERLHAVTNLQKSAHEKYLRGFEILTINYEGLFVFPDKSWEWDDQRGSVFGFSIHVHDFPNNVHRSYVDTGKGGSVVPIHQSRLANLTKLQLELLMETRWVQPIPEAMRTETMEGRSLDIIQTRVNNLPANEQKVEFALDRKTHLPLMVTYYWNVSGRERSGNVRLKDYVEIDGVKIPSRVGSVRSKYKLIVDYDNRVFEQPPSREMGIDAWKKR